MTVFVASLFLPYTVNFGEPPQAHAHLPSLREENVRSVPSLSSLQSLRNEASVSSISLDTPAPPSLFSQSAIDIPLVGTPDSMSEQDRLFSSPIDSKLSGSLPPTRHGSGAAVGPRLLRTLSHTDQISHPWGKAKTWNQPQSRAKSPPSASILKYNQRRERAGSILWRSASRLKLKDHRRASVYERQYSLENFSIEQGQLGNGGLYNAIDAASEAGELPEKTWVGTLGMPTDALDEHMKQSISERLEDDYESLTVFASDSDLEGHYEHYCKRILWPVFHYQVPNSPKSKAYEDHSWVFYVKVNEAFADRIAKNYKKGDIIWVHDYHLLLVPQLLRQKLPEAQIGFFMHTAFPSSEIFRCLATRARLLEGLLGASMIGVQSEEYAHHLLQTCNRLLNVEATKHGVLLDNGRFVHIGTYPIGIDPTALDRSREMADVADWVKLINDKYQGKRLLVARDKLESIRGVKQKMLAYEMFLENNPEYRDKVVLIQIAMSSTEEAELGAVVADIATRINSTYSTLAHQPLVFLKQDIEYSQYLALLTAAECLLITSMREGMNLTSHEYIYCQDGQFADTKYGPLILSEFTGSASVLGNHPVLINPWDYKHLSEAIQQSLDMPFEERKRRWKAMRDAVLRHTATHWYIACAEGLKHAWEEHSVRASTSVPRLSVPTLQKKYKAAGSRLIIVDYEGTLAAWGSPVDIIMTMPKRAVDVLNDLLDDEKNTVYVMSSRTPEELERLFCQVPGLGLIAENGNFLLEAGVDEWEEMTERGEVQEWKKSITGILNYYQERVEGSRIEERHASFIFDYTDADKSGSAFKQAGECASHINEACAKQRIHAVPIESGIYIGDFNINKGTAAAAIGERLLVQRQEAGESMPEFLLVIGDSRDDEYVFDWAHKQEKRGLIRDVCTVTLGGRSTQASATLTQGVTGVISTLQKLVTTSRPSSGSTSPKYNMFRRGSSG